MLLISMLSLTFTALPAVASAASSTGQPPATVFAAGDSRTEACKSLKLINPGSGGNCDNPDGPSLNKTINIAINMLSIVAGVIAVIMIIVSGLKYITSQGDSTQAANARKSLIYSLVGLVVVVLAQFIVKFVLARTLSS